VLLKYQKMKKLITQIAKVAMLIAFTFSANSCRDFMDVQPVSQYSVSQVFGDVPNATAALIGVYDELMGDNGYGIRISQYYPLDSDEMMCTGNLDNGRRGIARYQLLLSNIEIRNPFLQLYRGVEKANLCIEQIPLMKQYVGGTAQEQKDLKRLHGEALVLRAQFYFELIRNWGDVPAPMIPAYKQADLFLAQANRDDTYDKLIADLKLASDLMPWRTEVTIRNERLTKGAAKALRARLALYRGGFSLRTESSKMERRADYLTYYKIARDECAELMADRKQHTLIPIYEDIWKKYVCAFTPDPAYELIFEIGAGGGNSNSDSRMGNYNGVACNAASRYGVGNGAVQPLPNYMYAFDTLDTRRDITIGPYSVGATNLKVPRRLGELSDNKYSRTWRVPLLPGSALNPGYNWVVLRFSDVLLMFAEADNEINGSPTTAAIAAFEEVRKRAFAGNTSKIGVTPTTKQGFFDAVANERWLEFGGEGIRKYDLLRWNLLSAKIDEARQAIQDIRDAKGKYANVPLTLYWRNNGEEIEYYSTIATATKHPFNSPIQTPSPTTGWTKVDWRQHLISGTSADAKPLYQAFASLFTPNKSELFPFDQATMDAYQGKLKQNPGY
jgi:starch-binding outer membrane protein, SusD/RagB family